MEHSSKLPKDLHELAGWLLTDGTLQATVKILMQIELQLETISADFTPQEDSHQTHHQLESARTLLVAARALLSDTLKPKL